MKSLITLATREANGRTVHYASAGDPQRPLVLFLHGFPEAWFAWEDQLEGLGSDWFAVAPDLPGYNLSGPSNRLADYRAGVVASDLLAFVDSLGHQDFFVVGHDWGGALAYALALAQPARVRGLFVVNGVHPWMFWRELVGSAEQAAHSQYINTFRLQPGLAKSMADDKHRFLLRFLETGNGPPTWLDAAMQARYIEAWSRPGALDGALNYYRANPLYPAVGDDAGAAKLQLKAHDLVVKVPTTVLWGERDTFLLPGCIDGLEQVVPRLRLHRYPEASHWLVHEMPGEVTRRLHAHLVQPP